MRRARWLVALALGACGPERSDFIEEYTGAYCDWMIRCVDPSLLTFDGIDSPAACATVYKAEVAGVGLGCKYKGRFAEDCVEETRNATCPTEGRAFPATPSCLEVYTDCSTGFPETSFDTGAVPLPQ